MSLTISPELLAQIEHVIRFVRALEQQGGDDLLSTLRKMPSRFPPIGVVTSGSIGAGSLLTPSSGAAKVCEWDDSEGEYTETENTVTVYNHSQDEIEANTGGAAIFIDGHYWIFADCDPMEDTP